MKKNMKFKFNNFKLKLYQKLSSILSLKFRAKFSLKLSLSGEKRHSLEGLTFISPFIIGTIIFFIFPLFVSIKLSFGKLVKMKGFQIEWLGFDNYIRAFILDTNFLPMFLQVVRKTMIQVPLIIIFSILLAILVNKKIKFKGFFRNGMSQCIFKYS